jgi:hypothetical protein
MSGVYINTGRYGMRGFVRFSPGQQAVCSLVLIAQPGGGAAISQVTQPYERRRYYPTFPGFPVIVGRRIALSGVLGNGKRARRRQEAVETAR